MRADTAADVVSDLNRHADAVQAQLAQRYFKTGPGEYGEGDRFLGLRVPLVRQLIRRYSHLSLTELSLLLHEPWHEARLAALLIVVEQFKHGDEASRRALYRLYLAHTAHINNWDLVDCSAPYIVGGWLLERSRAPLYKLVRSNSLWERRISILATFHFIRHDDFDDALAISASLLDDREDLLHKAVGWMLREIGKRDRPCLEQFLNDHYPELPRTTLRYAIERFPERLRQRYLRQTVAG